MAVTFLPIPLLLLSSPLFFSTVTCFLFTRKKNGKAQVSGNSSIFCSAEIMNTLLIVSMSPPEVGLVEKFGARVGSEPTLHKFQCLNESDCMRAITVL